MEDSDGSEDAFAQDCENYICMQTMEPSTNTFTVQTTPSFDFSAALESIYPLTDMICSYLPYTDLEVIAEISDIWKESAQKEMSKRVGASWFILNKIKKSHVYNSDRSNNFNRVKKTKALFFYHYEKIKLNEYFCLHEGDQIKRRQLYEYFADGILDNNEENNFVCISLDFVFPFNPPSKDYIKTYFSGLILPQIPNIEIKFFYYHKQNNKTNMFDSLIGENEKLKCLLVFGISNPLRRLGHLMKDLSQKQTDAISLGGGLVWGIKSNSVETFKVLKPSDLYCIGFFETGVESNFYSASKVISEHVFEESLLEFKEILEFRENSMLFRFCCLAKEDKDIEDPLIRKHFPNTLLVQMDVNGEFGCNSENDEIPKKKSRLVLNYYHEYCSILVFISWGKKIDPR